jgi:hypothetical protein
MRFRLMRQEIRSSVSNGGIPPSGKRPIRHGSSSSYGLPGPIRTLVAATTKNESRLSDISLKWMLDAAVAVGLQYDPSLLHLYPDASGPQHDEIRSSVFKYAKKAIRELRDDAPLHPTVLERLQAGEVLNFDRYEEYRPSNLKEHKDARQFY